MVRDAEKSTALVQKVASLGQCCNSLGTLTGRVGTPYVDTEIDSIGSRVVGAGRSAIGRHWPWFRRPNWLCLKYAGPTKFGVKIMRPSNRKSDKFRIAPIHFLKRRFGNYISFTNRRLSSRYEKIHSITTTLGTSVHTRYGSVTGDGRKMILQRPLIKSDERYCILYVVQQRN